MAYKHHLLYKRHYWQGCLDIVLGIAITTRKLSSIMRTALLRIGRVSVATTRSQYRVV